MCGRSKSRFWGSVNSGESKIMSAENASLIGPDCEHGILALLVAVPIAKRKNRADIAEAYAVEIGYDIPGGCIVWGRYHGKWIANVSARWIVSQFIEGALAMSRNEQCGGDAWWHGCNAVMDLVRSTDTY